MEILKKYIVCKNKMMFKLVCLVIVVSRCNYTDSQAG